MAKIARYHAVFLSGLCKLYYAIATILKMSTQTITELDNKRFIASRLLYIDIIHFFD